MNTAQRIDKSYIGKRFKKLVVLDYSHRVKYKSGSCKKFWNCICDCGGSIITDSSSLLSGRTSSCGCSRNKGGKVNSSGYRSIYCKKVRKYVLQHRMVWESHYEVVLKSNQNIHHINGDRKDNRIENLELWDTSQPNGQRVEDKLEYYFSLIKEYKDNPIYKKLINFHLSDLDM